MTASVPVRRFALVAIAAPAAMTAIALAVQAAALPTVPDPVAIHWNAAGHADAFGPAWSVPAMTVAIGFALPLLLALATLPGLRRGDRGATYALMGGVASGLSALASVLLTWSLVMQAGLDDAADAPSILPGLVASYAAGAAVGVAAWLCQPRTPWTPPPVEPADPLALAAGERAAWVRSASISRVGAAFITAACLIVVGMTAWFAVIGADPAAVWILVGVSLLLVVLSATTVAFHVRVDEGGLRVGSVLGIPRWHIPLADVETAARVEVSPMGEFGGWGLRYAPGRFGVVLRTGEAIEVVRRDGRRFVVTVDDAGTAAALLGALAGRRRAGAGGAA